MLRNVAGSAVPTVVGTVPADISSNTQSTPTSHPETQGLTAAQTRTPPALYKDLWREVAKYTSRNDVLNLRTVSSDMAEWVDSAITHLRVSADKAPGLIAAIGNAAHLQHIDTLTVAQCRYDNFPSVITALAAVPHAALHVHLSRTTSSGRLLDEHGLRHLVDIAPASLHLSSFNAPFTKAEMRIFAGLGYPLSLSMDFYSTQPQTHLLALAEISTLTSLKINPKAVSDDEAEAFRQHPTLTELSLIGPTHMVMSDKALATIAHKENLETLRIGELTEDIGPRAIAALAANTSLRSLTLDTHYRPLRQPAALALSANTTLRELTLSLVGGCHHLASMRALESLTLRGVGVVSLEEAHQFARAAQLKALDLTGADYASGALPIMASSVVEHLKMAVDVLSDEDIHALVANRALRSLECKTAYDTDTSIRYAITLAGHPTLERLSLSHWDDFQRLWYETDERIDGPGFMRGLTDIERIAIYTAWGENRPPAALTLGF